MKVVIFSLPHINLFASPTRAQLEIHVDLVRSLSCRIYL